MADKSKNALTTIIDALGKIGPTLAEYGAWLSDQWDTVRESHGDKWYAKFIPFLTPLSVEERAVKTVRKKMEEYNKTAVGKITVAKGNPAEAKEFLEVLEHGVRHSKPKIQESALMKEIIKAMAEKSPNAKEYTMTELRSAALDVEAEMFEQKKLTKPRGPTVVAAAPAAPAQTPPATTTPPANPPPKTA